jgi:SAM-dependent methyltransferase
LDNKGFTESLPEVLRNYVRSHMPGILAGELSCACCADKEQASGKPEKVARELLCVYDKAFRGQPPRVDNYVDIGSGTCTTACAISKQLGLSKDQVSCLDIVESCGQRADDVTFMIFDGQTLPLPTASTDLISIVHVLHHVEPGGSSMFHLLQEIKRILRPGGVVIVKEHDSPNKDYDLYLEAMHSLKQLVFYTSDPETMPLGSYQSREEWQVTFRRIGLPVVYWERTNDIYNSVIMILENIADGD